MRMTATMDQSRVIHDALCREIEQHRIADDETPSTMGPKDIHVKSSLGRRRHTYSIDKTIPETSADASAYRSYAPSCVPLKDSPQPEPRHQRKRSATQSYGRSYSIDLPGSDLTKSEDHTDAGRMKPMKEKDKGFVMTGWLHKTSRPKNSKTRGHSRQRRKFRLTAHSLEYSHQLQKVAICACVLSSSI